MLDINKVQNGLTWFVYHFLLYLFVYIKTVTCRCYSPPIFKTYFNLNIDLKDYTNCLLDFSPHANTFFFILTFLILGYSHCVYPRAGWSGDESLGGAMNKYVTSDKAIETNGSECSSSFLSLPLFMIIFFFVLPVSHHMNFL